MKVEFLHESAHPYMIGFTKHAGKNGTGGHPTCHSRRDTCHQQSKGKDGSSLIAQQRLQQTLGLLQLFYSDMIGKKVAAASRIIALLMAHPTPIENKVS